MDCIQLKLRPSAGCTSHRNIIGARLKQIPNESIKKWAYANGKKLSHPVSVAAVCPGCSLHVVFSTKRRMYDANRDTSSCSAECPSCSQLVHFWIVDLVGHALQDGKSEPGVYMLPAPHAHMDMSEHNSLISSSVLQYCKTAQEIYFSGNLMATNVMIKTALETVFDDFLPLGNSRGDLPSMIRDSISSINHSEPLAKLCASTTKQGDLHALFQNHHGTTKETADAMMQLLETLVTYLYVLPARFDELETVFAKIKASADEEAEREAIRTKREQHADALYTRAQEQLDGDNPSTDDGDQGRHAA